METLFEPKAPPHLAFPNGTIKKHAHPPAPAANADGEYRECLKNHAATLGGHAVDGCGEFTPSPTFDPAVPSSLTCAACGCHRNFHRRLVQNHYRHHREPNFAAVGDSEDEDDDGAGNLHGHHFRRPHHRSRSRSRSPPPPRHYSASHMLLALSGGREAARSGPTHRGDHLHRRRARTKFSPEQKVRMHELSEKLGWRMPKRDDGAVEEFCRRIGVERGVFKVWMHNNKQTFAGASGGTPTSRRAAEGGDGDGGGGDADGAVGFPEGVDVNGGKFAGNGSPPSSPS